MKTVFQLFPFIFIMLLIACEQEITVNLPQAEDLIAVEGYIENDEPPFVILTKNRPYFATLNLEDVNNIFVKGAIVKVYDGTDTITLEELDLGNDSVSIVVYTSFSMVGEVGKTYTLLVDAEGKSLRAETTIPPLVPLDSVWFEKADSTNTPFPVDSDSLYRLTVNFTDPAGENNYYRYYTSNFEEFGYQYFSDGNSSFAISLFDGEEIRDVWLPRATSDLDTTNQSPFFEYGDTVGLRWCTTDRGHYEYWDTYGTNIGGPDPFSPPTAVKSNVEGGLGVWGGLGSVYYEDLIAKP